MKRLSDIDVDALTKLCVKFFEDNSISCAESIAQSDRVIENAYDLLEDIGELIGYVEYEEDE